MYMRVMARQIPAVLFLRPGGITLEFITIKSTQEFFIRYNYKCVTGYYKLFHLGFIIPCDRGYSTKDDINRIHLLFIFIISQGGIALKYIYPKTPIFFSITFCHYHTR